MRVLMVYGSLKAMSMAIQSRKPDIHHAPGIVKQTIPGLFTLGSAHDGIQGIVVAHPQDIERMRGLQADVVIEDGSFDLHGITFEGVLIAHVGLQSGADVWDLWRAYLRLYVLRP